MANETQQPTLQQINELYYVGGLSGFTFLPDGHVMQNGDVVGTYSTTVDNKGNANTFINYNGFLGSGFLGNYNISISPNGDYKTQYIPAPTGGAFPALPVTVNKGTYDASTARQYEPVGPNGEYVPVDENGTPIVTLKPGEEPPKDAPEYTPGSTEHKPDSQGKDRWTSQEDATAAGADDVVSQEDFDSGAAKDRDGKPLKDRYNGYQDYLDHEYTDHVGALPTTTQTDHDYTYSGATGENYGGAAGTAENTGHESGKMNLGSADDVRQTADKVDEGRMAAAPDLGESAQSDSAFKDKDMSKLSPEDKMDINWNELCDAFVSLDNLIDYAADVGSTMRGNGGSFGNTSSSDAGRQESVNGAMDGLRAAGKCLASTCGGHAGGLSPIFNNLKNTINIMFNADAEARNMFHIGEEGTGNDQKTDIDFASALLQMSKAGNTHDDFGYKGNGYDNVIDAVWKDENGRTHIQYAAGEDGNYTTAVVAEGKDANGNKTSSLITYENGSDVPSHIAVTTTDENGNVIKSTTEDITKNEDGSYHWTKTTHTQLDGEEGEGKSVTTTSEGDLADNGDLAKNREALINDDESKGISNVKITGNTTEDTIGKKYPHGMNSISESQSEQGGGKEEPTEAPTPTPTPTPSPTPTPTPSPTPQPTKSPGGPSGPGSGGQPSVPEPAKPNIVQPNTPTPNTVQPNTVHPNTVQPNTPAPGPSPSGPGGSSGGGSGSGGHGGGGRIGEDIIGTNTTTDTDAIADLDLYNGPVVEIISESNSIHTAGTDTQVATDMAPIGGLVIEGNTVNHMGRNLGVAAAIGLAAGAAAYGVKKVTEDSEEETEEEESYDY